MPRAIWVESSAPGRLVGLVELRESVSLGESARVLVSPAIWVESSAQMCVGGAVGVGVASASPGRSAVPQAMGGELGPGVAFMLVVITVGVRGAVDVEQGMVIG